MLYDTALPQAPPLFSYRLQIQWPLELLVGVQLALASPPASNKFPLLDTLHCAFVTRVRRWKSGYFVWSIRFTRTKLLFSPKLSIYVSNE